ARLPSPRPLPQSCASRKAEVMLCSSSSTKLPLPRRTRFRNSTRLGLLASPRRSTRTL
ncbi:hypothetical protein OC846_005919, partial [Tilletia horrida]